MESLTHAILNSVPEGRLACPADIAACSATIRLYAMATTEHDGNVVVQPLISTNLVFDCKAVCAECKRVEQCL